MKKIHFEIMINAPRQKVWESIVNDEPYREWAAIFMPGSYFEGEWKKGEKIKFLAKDEDGKTGGMYAEIVEILPYEYISIKHMGEIADDKVVTTDISAKNWSQVYENYYLQEANGKTNFVVDMDADDKFADMFNEIWPKALQKLKEIAERK